MSKTGKLSKRDDLVSAAKKSATERSQTQVTDLQTIQTYRRLNVVAFNEEQAKKITDQLAIEEQSKQKFQKRVFHDDYFLNFDINPILPQDELKYLEWK